MDSKAFAKLALKTVRLGFPELYDEHVRGRRAAFIKENAPLAGMEEKYDGKVLGKVPQHARLVWALAQLLHTSFKEFPSRGGPRSVSQICLELRNESAGTASATLLVAFRECVLAHFGLSKSEMKTHMLCVRHDWSVSLLLQADHPKVEKAQIFELLGVMLEMSGKSRWDLNDMLATIF